MNAQRRPARRIDGGEVSRGPIAAALRPGRGSSGMGTNRSPGHGFGLGLGLGLNSLLQQPLSRQQLKRLEEHRYRSAGASLLEPLMQVWWEWLVRRLPLWVAPNVITIIGLALNACTTLVLMLYCPTATEQAPLWAYLACALGLFIYQTLDAIDGKQARRTSSSSPLGELFDHGCDSLSTVFVVLGICIAVQLGTNPDWMFFCCFAGVFMFYCAHWQTYVSGTLRFGIIDVTEVQFFIIILFLLAASGGTTFWESMIEVDAGANLLLPILDSCCTMWLGMDVDTASSAVALIALCGAFTFYVDRSKPTPHLGHPRQCLIPVLDIQVKIVPALFVVAGGIFSCTNYFTVIFTGGVGKNGSTIAGTSVLSPFFHIGAVITLALMIYKKSTSRLFENNPCLYILAFGFVSAKITNKLVVAHMTKSEMHLQDTAFVGPGLLFLDQYFNSFINEYLVLWIALVWSLFDLIRYSVGVCNQIASHLHINIFKISPTSPVNSQEQNHHK